MALVNQSPLNTAVNDRFVLSLGLPNGLKQFLKNLSRDKRTFDEQSFQMSIIGGNIPKIVVPAMEIRYSGHDAKVSTHSRNSYDPLTIEFKVDNQFRNYYFIYNWMNFLNHDRKNIVDGEHYAGDKIDVKRLHEHYMTDVSINIYDEYGEDILKYTYYMAFPVSLGDIKLNYQNPEEMTCTVEFAFSQISVELQGEGVQRPILL